MWMKACQKSPILSFQTVIMYVLEKREQMKKSVIFLPRWSKAVHYKLNGKIIQERPRCKYTDSKARLSEPGGAGGLPFPLN